jgi:hypothetical protein
LPHQPNSEISLESTRRLTGFGKECSVGDQHIATRSYATSTPAMGDNISLYGQGLQQSETGDECRIQGGHRVSGSVRGDNSTLELKSVSVSIRHSACRCPPRKSEQRPPLVVAEKRRRGAIDESGKFSTTTEPDIETQTHCSRSEDKSQGLFRLMFCQSH